MKNLPASKIIKRNQASKIMNKRRSPAKMIDFGYIFWITN